MHIERDPDPPYDQFNAAARVRELLGGGTAFATTEGGVYWHPGAPEDEQPTGLVHGPRLGPTI